MFRSIFYFFSILCIGSVSFAGEPLYKFDMNLTFDGSKQFHSQVIAKANSKFSITQEFHGMTAFIEGLPKPIIKDGIEVLIMDFTVGTLDAQGKRVVRGTPQIISDEIGTATAATYNTAEQEVMSLSVSWTRAE